MEDQLAATKRAAARVRRLRLHRGWSARRLAEECALAGSSSLTRSTLAKIESGVRHSVTADELSVLAKALGTTPADLLAPVTPTESFASALEDLRRSAGHPSFKDLSKRIGYSASELGEAEGGTVIPSEGLVQELVTALGGDVDEFMDLWRAARHGRAVVEVPTPRLKPRELPPDVPSFTGRSEHLARLDSLLKTEVGPGVVVIAALSGTAGVGKTALAVHWAHQMADKFPDGCLYADLRGYSPDNPMEPHQALGSFLRSLGTPDAEIPHSLEERIARYRSALNGRRTLLVLDNARDTEQVRPLLPGTSSCFVILTSRTELAGLVVQHGAHRIDLHPMSFSEAFALLRNRLGDNRVKNEHDAAVSLVGYCAGLPLAIGIAAAYVTNHPTMTLNNVVSHLASVRSRLDTLDAGGDPRLAVRSVFSWSYQQLTADLAQAFRMLGLHPGQTTDLYALAALMDTDLVHARKIIDGLQSTYLITEVAPGRLEMHDLLRSYAKELALGEPPASNSATLMRLYDYYLYTAESARSTLYPFDPPPQRPLRMPTSPTPMLSDPAAAKVWLDAERPTLVALALHAQDQNWPHYTLQISSILWRHLYIGGHYGDALTLHGAALDATRRLGDMSEEGRLFANLGRIRHSLGQYDEALKLYESALDIRRQTGDLRGEARELGSLGTVFYSLGHYHQAAAHYQQAITISREVDDPQGESFAMNNMGITYERLGRYELALETYRQALAIDLKIGDKLGESYVLSNLGVVHEQIGQHQKALEYLEKALAASRFIGHREGEVTALSNLGAVHERLGRYPQALDCQQLALAISRELGYRWGEGTVLNRLGIVYQRLGCYEDAITHLQSAHAVSIEIGDPGLQAETINSLGETLLSSGNHAAALEHHEKALELALLIELPFEEARALNGIGRTHLAEKRIPEARMAWTAALARYEAMAAPEADAIRQQLGNLEASSR